MKEGKKHTLLQDPHVLPPFAMPAPHLEQVLSWELTRTVVDCMVAGLFLRLPVYVYVCRDIVCLLERDNG
jgi:hypothetical protein